MFSFLLLFHVNNTLTTIFTHKTTAPRILQCVSLFFQSFFGNSKFSTKTEIILVFVQTNKFWKFKWFLRKVTILRENLKKRKKRKKNKQKDKAPWSDSKSWVLFEWIMRDHVACSHESKAYRSLMHAFEMKKGHLW